MPSPTASNFQGQVCLSYWAQSSSSIWMEDLNDGAMLVVGKGGEIRRRNRTTGADLGVRSTPHTDTQHEHP